MAAYAEDLAYIHDAGFTEFARTAAPWLLRTMRQSRIRGGTVLDLGCGSGVWARELLRAGYQAVGIDISPAMIRIARRRAPKACFFAGSLFRIALPPCDAVTALGECVNYCFDRTSGPAALARFFRRVYRALRPGGIFAFDIAEPGQASRRTWLEGDGWAVLLEATERGRFLTRDITAFRRIGRVYRRSFESHRLRLYPAAELERQLRREGFQVEILPGYGRFKLPPAHAAFLARKP